MVTDVIHTDEGSIRSFATPVRNYQITRRLIPEDSNLMTQAKLYKLCSWQSVVKQQRNRRPRLRALRQFYPKRQAHLSKQPADIPEWQAFRRWTPNNNRRKRSSIKPERRNAFLLLLFPMTLTDRCGRGSLLKAFSYNIKPSENVSLIWETSESFWPEISHWWSV